MFDLMIAIVISAGGAWAGTLMAPIVGHPAWSMALGLLLAMGFYLVFTPLLYRRLRMPPLNLPRCPQCRDANRHFWIGRISWPRAEMMCAICGRISELWFEAPETPQISREMPSFLLVWPQSWGRWRALSSRNWFQHRQVEAYRKKFAIAPLGRWNSALDYGPFSHDVWEFQPDGTGKIFEHSGSGDNVQFFQWQPHAERAIRYRITWDEQEAEQDDTPDDAINWRILVYDFKIIEHYAPLVVMFEVPERETFKFGMTMEYLQFEGDIEDASIEVS